MRGQPAEGARAGARGRWAAPALLVALFVLHQDAWLWDDPRLVLGLPVGLAYHVAFCLAVTLVLLVAVRWGSAVETPPGDGGGDGGGRRVERP